MKIKTKVFIGITILITISLMIAYLFDIGVIPHCFITFIITTIIVLISFTVFTCFMLMLDCINKDMENISLKHYSVCFVQYLIFGILASESKYLKYDRWVDLFMFLAAYAIAKMFVYLFVEIICEEHVKDYIEWVDKKNKFDEIKNPSSIKAYIPFIKYYLDYPYKRIEPILIVVLAFSIFSGCAFQNNLQALGYVSFVFAILIAFINAAWALIKMSFDKSFEKIMKTCSTEYIKEVKMSNDDSNEKCREEHD